MRARARTGLHRALYWGHLRAAALLLDAGAQLSVLDHRVRGGPAEAACAPAAARGGVGSLRALARACKGGLPLVMRAPRCEARGSPKPEGFLVQGRTLPDLLSAANKRVARA